MHVHFLWCTWRGWFSPVFWRLNSGHQVNAAGLYQLSLLPACFNVCRLKRNECTRACGWYTLPHMLLEPQCLPQWLLFPRESLADPGDDWAFFFWLGWWSLTLLDITGTTNLNSEDSNSRPCACTISTVTHWAVSPAATLSFKNVFWDVSIF